MTTQGFIERCEAYYGTRYTTGQKPYIEKYLDSERPRALDFLFGLCLKTHSAKYGKLPDVAVFEELRPEVIDSLAGDIASQDLQRPALEDNSGYVSDDDRALFLAAVQNLSIKMRVQK